MLYSRRPERSKRRKVVCWQRLIVILETALLARQVETQVWVDCIPPVLRKSNHVETKKCSQRQFGGSRVLPARLYDSVFSYEGHAPVGAMSALAAEPVPKHALALGKAVSTDCLCFLIHGEAGYAQNTKGASRWIA